MDYKKVLRLHFVNHLSCREIAESCGDCSKTTVNEFLKRFRENPELSYLLSADQLLYRDFNKEAVYKVLARKGETLKHLWQKYNTLPSQICLFIYSLDSCPALQLMHLLSSPSSAQLDTERFYCS